MHGRGCLDGSPPVMMCALLNDCLCHGISDRWRQSNRGEMSTSGGDSADGGDATGEPGTSDRIAGNPRTGRYTTSAARDFLAETLDPDAAQNRQSLRRISAKKLIVALTVFFAGLASTYLSTHILADDAAEVAD